jgi:hypothetical protein
MYLDLIDYDVLVSVSSQGRESKTGRPWENDVFMIIPTSGRTRYLSSIFEASNLPNEKIIIIRTAGCQAEIPNCRIVDSDIDLNISMWWLLGIEKAKEESGRFVAVLNDDCLIETGLLEDMKNLLISQGTSMCIAANTTGSGWGHCFMLDISKGIFPDPQFRWWYGDDDLMIRAKRATGISKSTKIALNLEANELTNSSLFLSQIITEDRRRFYSKHKREFFLREGGRILNGTMRHIRLFSTRYFKNN